METTEGPLALADLRGSKVVLYFYPKDDTPGCTRERATTLARLARDELSKLPDQSSRLASVDEWLSKQH